MIAVGPVNDNTTLRHWCWTFGQARLLRCADGAIAQGARPLRAPAHYGPEPKKYPSISQSGWREEGKHEKTYKLKQETQQNATVTNTYQTKWGTKQVPCCRTLKETAAAARAGEEIVSGDNNDSDNRDMEEEAGGAAAAARTGPGENHA